MATCKKCDATWTGARIEHCAVCHGTFTGATAGDMHRVGDHGIWEGPDRRRCLAAAEMTDKGMAQNDRGQWTTGRSDGAWWEAS